MGDLGSIPGLGRSLGEGKGYPLQYSGLENLTHCSPWGHRELDTTEWLKKKKVSNRLVTKLDTCNNKRKYRVFNLQKFTEVRKHNCNTVCFAILEIGRIMMESIK